jgi:hypothetical protein
MGFARRVRVVSEKHLMTAAEAKLARKYGTTPPLPPKGFDLFWQKIYVPIYYLLPYKLRAKVMALMPGSHRRTWHTPDQVKGPAI